MINLESLVQAVQAAVVSANESLQGQSAKFMDQFFESIPPVDNPSEPGSLEYNNLRDNTHYRPKYVTLAYPKETANGIETIGVDVPLISVVPVVHSRIEEVVFRTALDVTENAEGNLQISFATKPAKSKLFGGDSTNSTSPTELEIRIKGDESPEGLRRLIEGYDRALRAQIPG